VKRFVTDSAFKGSARTVGDAVRQFDVHNSLGVQWRSKDLAAVHSTCRLSFQGCFDVAVTFDAYRVGNPSVETLTIVSENLNKQFVVMTTPQAFTCYFA